MRAPGRALFAAAVAWVNAVSVSQGDGQGCSLVNGNCICSDAGGNEWDVTELDFSAHQTRGPSDGCTTCTGQWNYHFDICRNVDVPQAIGCTPAGQTRMAYRIDEFAGTPTSRICEYLGPDVASGGNLQVNSLTGRLQGVALTYTYLARSMRVNLICRSNAPLDSIPSPVEVGGNLIDVNWETPLVCEPGGTTGWLIVILTTTALGVYAVGGVAYSRSTEPRKGVTHPHAEQWGQLPGLVNDGWFFTRVKLSENVGPLSFLRPSGSEYRSLEKESKKERKKSKAENKAKDKEPKEKKRKKSKAENKPKPKPKPETDGLLESAEL